MMKQYMNPWSSLTYAEMWDLFFQLLTDNPPFFTINEILMQSINSHLNWNTGYSTYIFTKVKELSPFLIGNPCHSIDDFSFVPLSLNVSLIPFTS